MCDIIYLPQSIIYHVSSTSQATILQSCQSPVDYTVLKDNTKWRRYSSEELSSGKPLAEWYSVLVTYDEYLASLESIPIRAIPAPYQQLSLDPATLPTLRALLKALKIEFVSTVSSSTVHIISMLLTYITTASVHEMQLLREMHNS